MRFTAILIALMVQGAATMALAQEEEIEDFGWVTACGVEECHIAMSGFDLLVSDASPDYVLNLLAEMPPVSAVRIKGFLSDMGDSTGRILLTDVAQVDDANEGNLQAMQGDWVPQNEEGPFFFRATGLEWQEWDGEDMTAAFAMVPGSTCADGTEHAGTVLTHYRIGDDPEADGCWVVEYIDETTMSLRDVMGDWGVIDFTRAAP